MADDYKTTGIGQGSGGAATAVKGDIVIDKNKTPEQYIKEACAMYIVPPIVRQKFPDLIKLIYETESMNKEEREYWLQIMPIMTEDQIVKFRGILVNERDQLAKIDAEYKNDISGMAPVKEINAEELKQKMEVIKKQEVSSEASEKAEEEELLKKLDEA